MGYAFSKPVSPPPNLPLQGEEKGKNLPFQGEEKGKFLPLQGEELFSPLPFWEGSGEGILLGSSTNTGSLNTYEEGQAFPKTARRRNYKRGSSLDPPDQLCCGSWQIIEKVGRSI